MNIGEIISKYGAPLLGAVIGGPIGAATTAIGQVVASQFGGDMAEPNALVAKIQSDPEAKVKLAEIESNHKIQLQKIAMHMAENELKYESQRIDLANQNTKSARENNAQTKTKMPEIISIIIMISFFFSIWIIANYHQEEQDQQILYMLLGTVSAAFGAVINYWIGTSASSARKDYLIEKLK